MKEDRLNMINTICELEPRLYHAGNGILKMHNVVFEVDVSICNPKIMLSYIILQTSCNAYDRGQNKVKKECRKFLKYINTDTKER